MTVTQGRISSSKSRVSILFSFFLFSSKKGTWPFSFIQSTIKPIKRSPSAFMVNDPKIVLLLKYMSNSDGPR